MWAGRYYRNNHILGWCYYNGHGVEQDYEKAVEWYMLAAAQGDALAQNNLGICYENGFGVEQDYGKAIEWYTLAIEQGNALAQDLLHALKQTIVWYVKTSCITEKRYESHWIT